MLRTTFGIDERERDTDGVKDHIPGGQLPRSCRRSFLYIDHMQFPLLFFPFRSRLHTSCTPEIIVSLSTQVLLSDISRKLSSISHVSAPTTTATTTASIASTILAVILHPAALLPKGSLVPFSFLHFVLSTSRHRPCNLGPNGSSHP